MKEIWKDIKDFEGRFKISNHGRLLSINGKYKGEKILRPCIDGVGYYHAQLRKKPLNRSVRIHVLVAETFLIKPEGNNICVNHLDGNKLNNHISNIEWTTKALNISHAARMGLMASGSDHHNAKLDEEKVKKIKDLLHTHPNPVLGRMFGVHRRTISDIRLNRTWLSVS